MLPKTCTTFSFSKSTQQNSIHKEYSCANEWKGKDLECEINCLKFKSLATLAHV